MPGLIACCKRIEIEPANAFLLVKSDIPEIRHASGRLRFIMQNLDSLNLRPASVVIKPDFLPQHQSIQAAGYGRCEEHGAQSVFSFDDAASGAVV